MTKKVVSLIFIIALVATSIFIINSTGFATASYEYTSNSVSQVNQASTQSSNHLSKVSSTASTVDQARQITYPAYNANFTTDKSEYKPGNNVSVTGTSSIRGINGSLSLSLTTPMAEQVFSSSKSANNVFFDDPSLANTSVNDWLYTGSNGPNGYNKTVGYLNVTTGTTDSLYYNHYRDIRGTFEVKFTFYRNSTVDNNNMTLSYYDGNSINSFNINATSSNILYTFDQVFTIDTTNLSVIPLNITLLGPSRFIINAISITYKNPNIDFSDGVPHSGTVENIWIHGSSNKQRDLIAVDYFVNSSTSTTAVSFNFTLPDKQLYIGEWQFTIIVTPINDQGSQLQSSNVFIIPLLVKYDVYFQLQRQYIYRGINGNLTVDNSIYKDETNTTTVYSPGDNIIFVGQLYTNVTGRENLDSNYFSTLTGTLNSSTFIKGTQPFLFNDTDFSSFSKPDFYSATGFNTSQLPTQLQNNYTWFITSRIPERGIYGMINQSLNLLFKSEINITASNLAQYSHDYSLLTKLNSINVKFDLNVSTYQIPFLRTYFLTEFVEGNFTVNTYHYNLTNLQSTNSAVNQTYDWQLSIPESDLLFSVYLKNVNTQDIEQNLTSRLLNDGKTFYFAGTLSANLDTSVSYHLGINWLNPIYSQEKIVHNLEFSSSNQAIYTIKGTLMVQLPSDTIQYRQGDNLEISFNVTVDQLNNTPASGLLLKAVVENNTALHPYVIEKGDSFTILMTLPDNVHTGPYTIQIYKAATNKLLGSVNIVVIPHEVNSNDVATVYPLVYSLFGAMLAIVVLVGFLLQILRKGVFK